MTTKTSHWRKIEGSEDLHLCRDILMAADGPLTGREFQKEFERHGKWTVNPGTLIWELGQNPGHKTSGGVRFPDGNYRYWLIAAPGWRARWIVTADKRIVPAGMYQQGEYNLQRPLSCEEVEELKKLQNPISHEGTKARREAGEAYAGMNRCKNEACGRPLSSGAFCGDTCKAEYFKHLQGRLAL